MSLIRCKECNSKVSDKAKTCPNCGAPVEDSKKNEKKKNILGCGCLLIILVFSVIVYLFFSNGQNSRQVQKKSSVTMPKYKLVDKSTYDAPIKTQIELHMIVSGSITEAGLRHLLKKIYNEVKDKSDFKYGDGKPTHIFIYLYSSFEHFSGGLGQWIAMLSKVGRDGSLEISIKKEALSQLIRKRNPK